MCYHLSLIYYKINFFALIEYYFDMLSRSLSCCHTCGKEEDDALRYFLDIGCMGIAGTAILCKIHYKKNISVPQRLCGYNFDTPSPSRTEIVARIEEEQKLVDANKKLIELFEGKIKEKIAEVWG